MGHIRLGRLRKTQRWREVIRLLDESPSDTTAVASATVAAAEDRLRRLSGDPSLSYCFWMLTRIAAASRTLDFENALTRLGLAPREAETALAFIAQVSDRVGAELRSYPESGPFGDIASLALRRALTETVGQEGRSLFGSSLDDLQGALQRHSTAKQFGTLAQGFFSDFFARTLRFFVEKELSNHVGEGHTLPSVPASQEFTTSLDLFARQSARIMEDFASGWFSKHQWESKDQISREEAQGFVAVALRKLRMELRQTEASP